MAGFSKHWTDFLGGVESARVGVGYTPGWTDDEVCYFRGQPNQTWPLLPSLYRHPEFARRSRRKHARRHLDEFFWQLESDLYFEFNARARELHEGTLSSWDVLFFMQHHGAPTRLLDWSEVFGVALYFALYDPRRTAGADPCIWVLNPFRLNTNAGWGDDLVDPKNLGWDGELREYYGYDDILTEDGLFGFEKPCAIYPVLRSSRLHAQRGSFTIFGDGYDPLDRLFPHADARQKVLRKVVLPQAAHADAKRFLRHAGIDHHLLFPDLGGLAEALRKKYGFGT